MILNKTCGVLYLTCNKEDIKLVASTILDSFMFSVVMDIKAKQKATLTQLLD